MILKSLDEGIEHSKIAKIFGVDLKTVYNTKMNFLENGLETALYNGDRPGRPIEIDERIRCQIASNVCSAAPEGFSRWTLDLVVESLASNENIIISRESVRLVLKDHELKPWLQKTWCIPKVDETFIERMGDVLDIYERHYDAAKPVVCLDEKPVHLTDNKRETISTKPGKPEKVDYEYTRNGQASIFVAIEPKAGAVLTKLGSIRNSHLRKPERSLSLISRSGNE